MKQVRKEKEKDIKGYSRRWGSEGIRKDCPSARPTQGLSRDKQMKFLQLDVILSPNRSVKTLMGIISNAMQ